jgi:uncharacterized RDD family membrane protein YckC
MFCTKCGAQNPDDAKFCFNCGSTLPTTEIAPPPPAPAYAPPSAPQVKPVIYAGFWRRFLAMAIDHLILAIPGGLLAAMFIIPTVVTAVTTAVNTGDVQSAAAIVLSMIVGWIWLGLLLFLLPIAYGSIFECSKYQATPGKMAIGIIVTDLEGHRITFARSLARNLGKIVSKIILYIGFIMAGLTEKKQALHDMFADCLVVMK